jgi:DNA-binding protein H-NS
MPINLDDLSLEELKDLQNRVAKAIANFQDRSRRAVLAEIEELARAKGFSLAELSKLSSPRKRAPAVAKYANPANKADTWSGRGRKPRWFVAALAAGKSPESLSI